MRCSPACIHCYLKQSLSAMRNDGTVSYVKQHEILYKIMEMIPTLDPHKTPCENSSITLLKTYEFIGNEDPYKNVKHESNELAISLFPKLREIIDKSDDKISTALKIAAAGNIIDLGIAQNFDINKSLDSALLSGFSIDDSEVFKKMYSNAKEIVIAGDNAGEIAFDRLLVELFVADGKRVKYIVKDAPILNDATVEDAEFVGLNKVAEVISSGARSLGTQFGLISHECEDILRNAELIISKGQANYETLENEPSIAGKVFFLLKLKCEEVVDSIGSCDLGQVVFIHK